MARVTVGQGRMESVARTQYLGRLFGNCMRRQLSRVLCKAAARGDSGRGNNTCTQVGKRQLRPPLSGA